MGSRCDCTWILGVPGFRVERIEGEAADAQDDGPFEWQPEHVSCFFAARHPRPHLYGARQETDPFLRDAPGAKVPNSPGPIRFDPVRTL